MIYVLLLYGAAFIAMGFALGLQARASITDRPLPRPALWLASGFGVVHGAAEWALMAGLIEHRLRGRVLVPLGVAAVVLLGVSFALLAAFGLALLDQRRRRRAVLVPAAFLGGWGCAGALGIRAWDGSTTGATLLATFEAGTRYALALPACVAAGAGLFAACRRLQAEEWRAGRYIQVAATVVLAYAVFTGLVVPRAPFPPASFLNAETFSGRFLVPVEVFRAACAAAIGLLLSEAFVYETTRRLHREVEHLRDDFIALVAHDLRTPLQTVEMGSAVLEDIARREGAPERTVRVVTAIRSATRTMRTIVSDLLDATRIESHRLAVSPERVEVVPLLHRVAEWAGTEARRGHPLRLAIPDALPPVLADPARVEQVLGNLLSNAGKYSFPGTEIQVEASHCEDRVTISVMNEGAGIAPEELSRVFSRHYRTRAAEHGKAQGLGLGLYISKGLVEAHGGRMWAMSDPGRLTTFAFTLPCADAPPRAPPRVRPFRARAPPRAG